MHSEVHSVVFDVVVVVVVVVAVVVALSAHRKPNAKCYTAYDKFTQAVLELEQIYVGDCFVQNYRNSVIFPKKL